ncbi:hypothetical protein OLA23_10470, partial [Streptococcus pneumoniae]|nr:hypothetical protein [Streptococcus pneumoniae]
RVELIKMEKGIVRLTLEEQASSEIDGQKLFALSSKYGRDIGLGMEGSKLIISVQTKGKKTEEWLEIVLNMLRGLQEVKKETIPSS